MKLNAQKLHQMDHAPGADLDYAVDWQDWLAATETIVESTWAAPTGITLSRGLITDGRLASTFALGGVAGQSYIITNSVLTSANRRDARSIELVCKLR